MKSEHTVIHTATAHITVVSIGPGGRWTLTQKTTNAHRTFWAPVYAPMGFTGWAAIRPWVQEKVLSAGSQDSAVVSSAQKQSQGLNNRSRRTGGQIDSQTMYSLCLSSKIFLIIWKLTDSSLMAAHSHAAPPQQHGSDVPWAAKCLLWKVCRQLLCLPKSTAVVPQCLFWRDCCQVIQINTRKTQAPLPALLFPLC